MDPALPDLSEDKYTASITPFQKRVYSLLIQIPPGRVTTYGALARALNTSPRAVGNALRNNIFAPQIPCHRCVATNGYVNGYDGEVIQRTTFGRQKAGSVNGKSHQSKARGAKAKMQSVQKTEPPSGHNINMKLDILKREGVEFDEKGMLLNRKSVLFDGPWSIDL
ncbi:MAG: hypothetical protein M1820_010747 [Bogoriella megaspora]|nr:MAG: hypothetical protein M1820_010747 [Bogoriella megaspora]